MDDPFTMGEDESFPHVLFSAVPYDLLEDAAATKISVQTKVSVQAENGSVCLIIPSFTQKQSLILIALDTLNVTEITVD